MYTVNAPIMSGVEAGLGTYVRQRNSGAIKRAAKQSGAFSTRWQAWIRLILRESCKANCPRIRAHAWNQTGSQTQAYESNCNTPKLSNLQHNITTMP